MWGGWRVADTKYLYPARWGWINIIFKNRNVCIKHAGLIINDHIVFINDHLNSG